MADVRRTQVLGVPVDCLDMPQALAAVAKTIKEGKAGAVLAVNPEKVIRAQADPALLEALRSARLLIPDGIGVVLAARLLGLCRMQRVAGSELMPAICGLAAEKGYPVFLFGAREDVNAKAAEVLTERFPGLEVAGRHNGYVADPEMPSVLDAINRSGARVLFVALGSPAQERWVQRYLPGLKVSVCQGVGGTLDVIAGRVPRAPPAWIGLRLEWLYRLFIDPRRISRQKALPVFAAKVIGAWLKGLVVRPHQ